MPQKWQARGCLKLKICLFEFLGFEDQEEEIESLIK
jgi:hypothetical protein